MQTSLWSFESDVFDTLLPHLIRIPYAGVCFVNAEQRKQDKFMNKNQKYLTFKCMRFEL